MVSNFSSAVKFIRFAFLMVLIFGISQAVFAQNTKFEQKISWQIEKNASAYKVELVEKKEGAKPKFYNTEETFVKLSLPAGIYRYRVYAYDFLGRESSISEWTDFEILKAKTPEVKVASEKVEKTPGKNEKVIIPVEVDSVTEESVIELVNTLTNETVSGKLVKDSSKDKEEFSKAEFENLTAGEWKIKITNPSGLQGESQIISIVEKKEPEKKAETPAVAATNEAAKAMLEKYPELSDDERRRRQSQADLKYVENELARREAKKQQEIEAKKKEEEKAKAKEEQKVQPVEDEKKEKPKKEYKFKDMGIALGGGIMYSPFENSFTEDSDSALYPVAILNFNAYPVKLKGSKLGLEADAKVSYLTGSTEYFEKTYPFSIFELNLVYQKDLYKNKILLNAKAGGNVFIFNRQFKYTENHGWEDPEVKNYGYLGAQGGLNVQLMAGKRVEFILGADYDHIFMSENRTSFLCPYALVGVRW